MSAFFAVGVMRWSSRALTSPLSAASTDQHCVGGEGQIRSFAGRKQTEAERDPGRDAEEGRLALVAEQYDFAWEKREQKEISPLTECFVENNTTE